MPAGRLSTGAGSVSGVLADASSPGLGSVSGVLTEASSPEPGSVAASFLVVLVDFRHTPFPVRPLPSHTSPLAQSEVI